MPRPKPNYNPPADLLDRLPRKPIITTGDKLAALNTMFHRCEIGWRDLHLSIINAIREDIRLSAWRKREAQKGSAPVRPEAPSNPKQSTEVGSSIPDRVMERKAGQCILRIYAGRIELSIHTDPELFTIALVPDEADQLAHALTELAGDLRQEANARALLNTTG